MSLRQSGLHSTMIMCPGPVSHSTRISLRRCAGTRRAHQRRTRATSIAVPEAELAELRNRINAARWPERETVTDDSQGVPLAMIQEFARYRAADYDCRRCEAKLNALPQFITEIDGLDIHFIHVRSDYDEALPLISRTAGPARSSSR
jgi:hypothetical protein